MKSEKTGNVAIQFENSMHNQERDKTQKKIKIWLQTQVEELTMLLGSLAT